MLRFWSHGFTNWMNHDWIRWLNKYNIFSFGTNESLKISSDPTKCEYVKNYLMFWIIFFSFFIEFLVNTNLTLTEYYSHRWYGGVKTTESGEPRGRAVCYEAAAGCWSASHAFRSAHVRPLASRGNPVETWPLPDAHGKRPAPKRQSTATAFEMRVASPGGRSHSV